MGVEGSYLGWTYLSRPLFVLSSFYRVTFHLCVVSVLGRKKYNRRYPSILFVLDTSSEENTKTGWRLRRGEGGRVGPYTCVCTRVYWTEGVRNRTDTVSD